MTKKTLKLIAVDALQYGRLKELGKTAMSFNDVIKAVLDERDITTQQRKKEVSVTN